MWIGKRGVFMSKWTRTAGLIFLAAASVYSNRAALADGQGAAPAASEVKNSKDKADPGVKVLEESADPFANSGGATTKPAVEGKSVSASEVNVSDAGAVEIHVND